MAKAASSFLQFRANIAARRKTRCARAQPVANCRASAHGRTGFVFIDAAIPCPPRWPIGKIYAGYGGILAIHDVFPNPPMAAARRIGYKLALHSGLFEETAVKSLRVEKGVG